MPGDTPANALHIFVDPLQRAISCVTRAVLTHTGFRPEVAHLLMLGGNPVRLRGDQPRLLSVWQSYEVMRDPDMRGGPWDVRTLAYSYGLLHANGREILAYHWHPQVENGVRFPHVHVRSGDLVG